METLKLDPFELPKNRKLYALLADELRQKILDGTFAPGDLLPSEGEMAMLSKVSRITVRQAITLLVDEGLVERIQGKGTFVQALKVEQNFLGLHNFAHDLADKGYAPGFKILNYALEVPKRYFRELFKLGQGERVHTVQRMKLNDGNPIMLEHLLLPEPAFPSLPREEIETKWLAQVLQEQYGVQLRRVRKTLQPITIGQTEAELLGVSARSLGLLVDRLTWKDRTDTTPIMVTRSIVPAEFSKFYVDLEYDVDKKDH